MIKVCFRKGGHPAYDDILNYPPEGVIYREIKFAEGKGGSSSSLSLYNIKKILFGIYKKTMIGNINAIHLPCDGNIIFSCGGLMPKTHLPWITDVEHGVSLLGIKSTFDISKKSVKKTAEYLSKSNAKILPWSLAAKASIREIFGKHYFKFKDKIEVLYPGIPVSKEIARKKYDTINFLYVNRIFWGKCGYETLKAFDIISINYDVKLYFVSDTPNYIKNKFEKNKNIIFYKSPIPRSAVFNLYRKSHIFLFPTLFDTFGYVLLEAMAHALPVIATEIFAIPEIIEHEKGGFLIKPEYSYYRGVTHSFRSTEELYKYAKTHPQDNIIANLVKCMRYFIENSYKIEKFGKYNYNIIKNGKFSVKNRNRKLLKLYMELSGEHI